MGLQWVPTKGIANLVERWSFVILGEHIVGEANHMHYNGEINYHDLSKIVIFFQHRNVHVLCSFQYYRTNSLHNTDKICLPCHPTGSKMVNPMWSTRK